MYNTGCLCHVRLAAFVEIMSKTLRSGSELRNLLPLMRTGVVLQ